MKYLLFVIFLFIIIPGDAQFMSSQAQSFVDPTGTYILKGKFTKSELKGHYGEIRVKLLDSSSIAMTFYMNSGYPAYFDGFFIDTLNYDGARAAFSCRGGNYYKIAFRFTRDEVEISQAYMDPHYSCSFPKGVIFSGFIKKYSGNIPVIKSLRGDFLRPNG